MMKYNFSEIEKKWQDIWDEKQTFAAKDDYTLPKFYALVEFPYPSACGRRWQTKKSAVYQRTVPKTGPHAGNKQCFLDGIPG